MSTRAFRGSRMLAAVVVAMGILDGLHAIAWVVRDSAGNTGSRYFEVRNGPVTTVTSVSSPMTIGIGPTSVAATAAGASSMSPRAQAEGTIAGTVRDKNGAAIPAVSVAVHGGGGEFLKSAQTGADGAYSLIGLAAGQYFVRTEPSSVPHNVPELYNGIPCAAADCTPTSGTPVTVAPGAATTIDFNLAAGGRIEGVVTLGDTGLPASSFAFVQVYNESTSQLSRSGGLTAMLGQYAIEGLPPGRYYLYAFALPPPKAAFSSYFGQVFGCAGPCALSRGTLVTVQDGGTTSGVNFTLTPAGRITGLVTAPSFSGATVCAYSVGGVRACTDPRFAGFDPYVIGGLPPGIYRVKATLNGTGSSQWYGNVCGTCESQSQVVTVVTGGTTAGIDFTFAPSPSGTIAGRVSVGGSPAGTRPFVSLHDSTGAVVKLIGSLTESLEFSYRFDRLAPGLYYLRAGDGSRSVDELFDDIPCVAEDCDVRRGTPVSVTAGGTTDGIDFRLSAGGTIEGSVPSGTSPLVEIYDSRGVRVPSRGTRDFTTGAFVVPGLPAGVYFAALGRTFPSVASEIYGNSGCGGCPVTSGRPIVVRAGEVTKGIDFGVFTTRTVSGTVRDAVSGDPLSTITIAIVTASGAYLSSGVSDRLGHYAVASVPPGTYFARSVNARGYVDERYNEVSCGACGVTGSTPIVVSSSDVSGIDFALSKGTYLSGSVTTRDGVGVTGAAVTFRSVADSSAQVRTFTSGAGFAIALPPGSYRVNTEPFAGLNQKLFRDVTCTDVSCSNTSGAETIVVGATDLGGIDFALDVCTAPSVLPLRLASAAVGSAYQQTLSGVGGTAPFSFTVTSGALPPGLTLNAETGVLSGTPTAAGRYTFTIAGADTLGCVGTREHTLEVPACAFTLTTPAVSLRATGEPWLVQVMNACGTWTATSNESWLHVVNVNAAAATVLVVADANPGPAPRTGTVAIGPRVFTVSQSGPVANDPFGAVDSPGDGVQVTGSVAITGWALDDLGVLRVLIYRDPVNGEGPNLVFVGQATFVPGARPDVERAYPGLPFNRRAGWGYLLLSNMLPNRGNGIYRIYAYAEDADLRRALIGTRTIVGINGAATLPFGAIDTPGQGEAIGGAGYFNWGWALTPTPQTVPTNGSTIQVVIDGVPLGTVTYNLYRPDVATLFPNYNNSAGPVGYRVLDTTSLEEGLHTIAWVVTDDGGRTQGIGSRYFEVRNSAWSSVRAAPFQVAESSAVRGAGIDLGRRAASLDDLPLGDDGIRVLTVSQLERIALDITRESACAPTYAGYSVASGEMRELPVGSALDAASGIFYWQPGPGFIGSYDLLFVRTACSGERERIRVRVRVGP
jgi:hypothetical protein